MEENDVLASEFVALGYYSVNQLLKLYADVLVELKKRNVVRSSNNPVSDFCEWLVADSLGLTLQPNSTSGFDALDSEGKRYQIKARRQTATNTSRQLGVIRNLEVQKFDYLIAILFNMDFSILEAYQIPHGVIGKHARYSEHQIGHILVLRGAILSADGVVRIDAQLEHCLDACSIPPQL
ncbi:MAG TPA: hypothetical protein PLZ21_03540 [Armatimonadota bacterium]|nr:hypothetical protein [Armatimonadota bacterium]